MSASASARLGDFVEILSGFAFDAANFSDEGDIALIRIRDVLRGRSNTFYRGGHDEKYLINEGEILIGMDGEFNRARWQSAPALLNQRVCKINSSSPRLADEYLFHFLPAALKSIEDATSFVTVKHLSAKQIREIEIPLPPVEEQRRIAAILDQAETLRTQRRQALAHLDTLTQSLFLDMFGDPVENEKSLPICQLHTLCNRITDGTHQSPDWVETGIPFLFISNIVDGAITFDTHKFISEETYFELTRRCPIEIGDVLYTTVGSYGNAAVVTDAKRFAFQRHIAHIKPDRSKTNSLFLAAMIQSVGVRRQVDKVAKGVAQKTVNLADLKGLTVYAPPLPLQQTFATRIAAIEALKATHRTALAQLDALFASLQQRAFSGELTQQTAQAAPKKNLFADPGVFNPEKGLEALVHVVKRLKGKGHYSPTKALYFADRHHLNHHGHTIYGEIYLALPHGPVPQAAYNASRALEEGMMLSEFHMDDVRQALRRDGDQLIALRDAKKGALSPEEIASLDWAIRYVKDMSFEQLKTASHDSAYNKTAVNQPIALQDIIATLRR